MSTVAEFREKGWIEITGCDLAQLMIDVYATSKPQGLGALHFNPEPMTREQAETWIAEQKHYGEKSPLTLDYVQGRACKFHVFTAIDDATRWFIQPSWYDHNPLQLLNIVLKHAPNEGEKVLGIVPSPRHA